MNIGTIGRKFRRLRRKVQDGMTVLWRKSYMRVPSCGCSADLPACNSTSSMASWYRPQLAANLAKKRLTVNRNELAPGALFLWFRLASSLLESSDGLYTLDHEGKELLSQRRRQPASFRWGHWNTARGVDAGASGRVFLMRGLCWIYVGAGPIPGYTFSMLCPAGRAVAWLHKEDDAPNLPRRWEAGSGAPGVAGAALRSFSEAGWPFVEAWSICFGRMFYVAGITGCEPSSQAVSQCPGSHAAGLPPAGHFRLWGSHAPSALPARAP